MTTSARPALVPVSMDHCICQANKRPCDLCCGNLCFLDAGIHVVFRPKKNEDAVAVALDGCVFTDSRKKCDGMFVLFRSHRIDVLLVELKGSHLEDAYEQIVYCTMDASLARLSSQFSSALEATGLQLARKPYPTCRIFFC